MQSTASVVVVKESGAYRFSPVGPTPDTALIFYPGGKVPPSAYAPAAVAIAEQGYTVFIVPMPINEAFFGVNLAEAVQAAHPDIKRWAMGGHSLGGAMAAEYTARHPGAVQGLLFWASYSAADLSGQRLKVISVFGALESGRSKFISENAKAKLPNDTTFIEIPGGNHEQFGYYTGQLNDPPSAVSRTEQQAQAVAAAVQLLEAIRP